MKLVILLPGFLDSPEYLHIRTFEKRLKVLGYTTVKLDLCNLWKTGNAESYSITNCLKQIENKISFYKPKNPKEIILIGHSMGGFLSIIAGSRINEVTKIISLCPPPDRKHSKNKWEKGKYRVSKRDLPDNPQKFREFKIPYSFVEDGLQYVATEDVKKIHKPLMIFIALDDIIVPPKQTEKIIKNAHSPYVVKQKKMGHDFRFSQDECNIVMKEIEKFILS